MPLNLPSPFLGATKRIGDREVLVTEIELEEGVTSGVRLKAMAQGLVPIHEEHEARLERSISLSDWSAMDVFEKALIIANRRNRIQIHNLQEEAQVKKSKRITRRK